MDDQRIEARLCGLDLKRHWAAVIDGGAGGPGARQRSFRKLAVGIDVAIGLQQQVNGVQAFLQRQGPVEVAVFHEVAHLQRVCIQLFDEGIHLVD